MRRLLPTLALSLVFLAGCGESADGESGTGAGASPSAPATTAAADPVEAITSGMDRSFEKSFAMEAKIGAGAEMIDLGGTIDPATGEMTIKMGGAEPLELIITREAVYMKQDEPDRKPWVRLDRSRLKADGPLGQAIDVRSQAGILAGVVSAESVGGGKYTGTADLAKAVAAADNESQKQSLEQAAKVVKNGSAVPFEATLDGEGRLTDLSYVFDTPAGEITTELAFHSFGEPVAIEPPPATETEEAPEELYMFF